MLGKKARVPQDDQLDLFDTAQDTFYNVYDRFWFTLRPGKLTGFLLASFIILTSGLTMNGNWLLLYVSLEKQLGFVDIFQNSSVYFEQLPTDLSDMVGNKLDGLPYYILGSILSAYLVYFPVCCFIHWYFYIRQKDYPEVWKCQPRKFMSWKDERHAVISGVLVLTLVSSISGFLSCYIGNGGYSTLYYKIDQKGWLYYWVSFPALLLITELTLYYAHRTMHFPLLYKTIHKWHHRYKQPTPFSATAMHPLEMILYQICIFCPIFLIPLHWSVFLTNIMYLYYYNVLGHSGVKLSSIWPWQPSTTFHDNHHQYFHVNFGFNLDIWDKIHGTYRVKNRIYNETTFYGAGKDKSHATLKEIQEHSDNIVDDLN